MSSLYGLMTLTNVLILRRYPFLSISPGSAFLVELFGVFESYILAFKIIGMCRVELLAATSRFEVLEIDQNMSINQI